MYKKIAIGVLGVFLLFGQGILNAVGLGDYNGIVVVLSFFGLIILGLWSLISGLILNKNKTEKSSALSLAWKIVQVVVLVLLLIGGVSLFLFGPPLPR